VRALNPWSGARCHCSDVAFAWLVAWPENGPDGLSGRGSEFQHGGSVSWPARDQPPRPLLYVYI
jgi:hypothetical protein